MSRVSFPPSVTGTGTRSVRLVGGIDEQRLLNWFAERGWVPQPFQRRVWRALARGSSGLLFAGTGSGKTLAVWFGALLRLSDEFAAAKDPSLSSARARLALGKTAQAAPPEDAVPGLRVVWITPMRALAADTQKALSDSLAAFELPLQVGLRTGDTVSGERSRQDRNPPFALVTTPESLTLLIARADARARLKHVRVVIVDEWHELMGSKRGVQVELALARLNALGNEAPVVWGLSATLANADEALDVLLGGRNGVMVRAALSRRPRIDTLAPEGAVRVPWSGHLGAAMSAAVVREIEASASTLVFCNTRAQAELWYAMLLDARPDWAGVIALHHGSLDVKVRRWVERGIAQGLLRCVVCTSSLDLGVDFAPVERVLQIGSAKGVARLMQRAGRSGHRPGASSRLTLVPTHALELVEAAAARDAVAAGALEPRRALRAPLDVLLQHLVTVAAGGGFIAAELFQEIRSTHAFRALDEHAWGWALGFVRDGGALAAYPEYRKLHLGDDGIYRVAEERIARRHRMSIGTIVADAAMEVRWLNGARLGTVEEGFIARIKPGERFVFAGRTLELVRVHELSAWVRRASGSGGIVPRWRGGRMPLSAELARAVLSRLDRAAAGLFEGAEMQRARPLLAIQAARSRLPGSALLLAERLVSREGEHLFVYPFAGRHANLGLACLLAWRAAQVSPATVSIAVNDYGFELLARQRPDAGLLDSGKAFAGPLEEEEVLAAVNAAELARRRFREIARVAGLIFQGHPGERRSSRALQASATMFHDAFAQHDPRNPLLAQARSEVLEGDLEFSRLREAIETLGSRRLEVVRIDRPTPFAMPLMVERLRETLTNEKLSDRVARLVAELEAALQ